MVLIFKRGQLVRLRDLPYNIEYNGQLARIETELDESDGCFEVTLRDTHDEIEEDDDDDDDDDGVELNIRVEPANMMQVCANVTLIVQLPTCVCSIVRNAP